MLGVAYAFIDEGYDRGRLDSKDDNSNRDGYLDAKGTMLLHDFKLVWVGLAGMTDPLRNGVKELMPQFHNAGIDTVMITGDQTPTAFAIGKELNLSNGDQLEIIDSTHLADIAPGLALALEPPEPDVLSQPPRNPDEPIIRKSDFKRITFEAALLYAGSFGAYGYGMMRYGRGAQAGSMAFLSLTMGQLIHALSCRITIILMRRLQLLLQCKGLLW